jgi:hypothetical protein
MKRDNQLIVESSIIGSFLIFVVLGGSIATTSVPRQWSVLANPGSVPSVQDPNGLSLYYNQTLTLLGTGHYSNVSLLLETADFVNFADSLNQTAQTADTQIASLNVTVPRAAFDLQLATSLIAQSQYLNASAYAALGCGLASQAKTTLAAFEDSSVPRLTSLGVPAAPYSIGLGLTSDAVSSLVTSCAQLKALSLYPVAKLSIGSRQKSVETGGSLVLSGNLTLNGEGIAGQSIFLYFNGTLIGTIPTSSSGKFGGKVSIPFVYQSVGVVQAFVATNGTAGFGASTSNPIVLLVLFNGTKIELGDPPAYLPTSSFQVHGNLTTSTGTPLPNAPVKLTFIDEAQDTTTDSSGGFAASFTVPPTASDGAYEVTAAFAPTGVFGPSFNFTSIEVVHEPLNMTVTVSSLTLAGFSASVQGQVMANGTGIPNANVIVSSPWGSFQTTSDSTGKYSLSVPTSLSDFSFSGPLKVGASPAQPYISSSQVTVTVGLLNPLIIVIPTIILLGVGFEARSLGLFGGESKTEEASNPLRGNETSIQEAEDELKDLPEMLVLYRRTLKLARARFQMAFGRNLTLREISAKMAEVSDERGAAISARILHATEAFLYSERFDPTRFKEAEENVSELEEIWKI